MFTTLTISENCPYEVRENYKEVVEKALKDVALHADNFLLVKVYLNNTSVETAGKVCHKITTALTDLGLTKFLVVPLNEQVKDITIGPAIEDPEFLFAQLCLVKLKNYITEVPEVTVEDWIHWDTITALLGVEGRNALVNFNFLDIEVDDIHFSYWYRIKEEYCV